MLSHSYTLYPSLVQFENLTLHTALRGCHTLKRAKLSQQSTECTRCSCVKELILLAGAARRHARQSRPAQAAAAEG